MKKITTQITIISLTLVVVIISIISTTILINYQNKKDASIINISGKQRMLTQRVGKNIFYLTISQDSYLELNSLIYEFDSALSLLKNGDESRGIYPPPNSHIKKTIYDISEQWSALREEIERFIKSHSNVSQKKSFFIHKNREILKISNDIVKELVDLKEESSVIDIAGFQRMLSQKLAYHLTLYSMLDNKEDVHIVYDATQSYSETLKIIEKIAKRKDSNALKSLVEKNLELWREYERDIDTFLKDQSTLNSSLKNIEILSERLLNLSDELTMLYTIYSEDRREFLEKFQYFCVFLIFFITLYVVYIIKGIRLRFDRFIKNSKDLSEIAVYDKDSKVNMYKELDGEDELSLASKHLKNFIDRVADFEAKSKENTRLSNKLTDDLLNLSIELRESLKPLDIDSEQKKRLLKQISISEDMIIQSSEDILSSAKRLEGIQGKIEELLKR